jgi:hypothetical protein
LGALLQEESSELTADAPSPDVTMAAVADVLKKDTASVDGSQHGKSDFAYTPDDEPSHWKFPIFDASHVRNALARFNQADIPESAKAGVKAKIDAAAKKFGIDVSSKSATAEKEPTMSDTKTEDGVVEAPVVEVEKVETVEAPVIETDVEKSIQKFVNEAVSTLNTKIEGQETVLKSLASSVETISTLLNTLKHLPAPFKGVVNTTAVAVSKEQDSAGDVQKVAPKDAQSAFKLALAPENAKSLDPRA